jgi:MOSC domain-containing protein YiiM
LQKRVLDLVYAPGKDEVHPGDTFIVDMDLSHENLPIGTVIKAGSALLRVSDHWNNACVKWKVRYGTDALEWVRQEENIKFRLRGVLCEVIEDGTIVNGELLQKI